MKTTALFLMASLAARGIAQDDISKPISADGKRVCRREMATGSIMPGRMVCLTRAEWRKLADVRDEATDAFRNRPHPNLDTRPE